MRASLDLGCGHHKLGTVNADLSRDVKPDLCCDAQQLPFKPGSFNKVIMYEVLEHLEDPMRALRDIRRVLVPGGILDLTIPNIFFFGFFLWWILKGARRACMAYTKDHVHAWRYFELKNLLERARFQVVTTGFLDHTRFWKPSHIAWLLPHVTKHHIQIIARA